MMAPVDKGFEYSASPARVLVIEEDETHAQGIVAGLESAGHCACTIANSRARGAALIENDVFDVVLADFKMADVDGLAILRKVKERLPDAEVILMTGHASINSAIAAMQGGAYAYLTKPLDIHEVRAAVDKASGRRRGD
ncbi:MAG TPA: response regulator [Planctomycetaceae bacterium]|nr:response regulator [Planctomycetaceae bacterium]